MSGKLQKGEEPVPGYRLVRFLGQGAFGQVWHATAPGGTEAALKIISLSGKQGLKEFRALGLVKRIRHPNLVPIVAFWLKDQAGNLLDDALALEDLERRASEVSELVATMVVEMQESPKPVELVIAMGLGEKDLARRLEECRSAGEVGIPVKELLGYMEDAARAIDYLNRPRTSSGAEGVAVQHCDIKPFNIMVVGDAAQVCDFGLARMLGDVRKTATAAGTVAYVAPECLSNCEPSHGTDQYSLAVTYVELRTGALPYKSEKLPEVINAVLKGELDLSRLPEAEQPVIRRATALDPFDRWPSAMEMVHALRRAIEAPPIPPKQSHSKALVMTSVAVVAILTAFALSAWQYWQKVHETILVETPTQNVSEDEPVRDFPPTDTSSHQASPPDIPVKEPVVVAPIEEPKTPQRDPNVPVGPSTADVEKVVRSAKELFDRNKYDEALALLNPIIGASQEPNLEALLLRGTVYLDSQRLDKAIADFTAVLKRNGSDVRALSRRGTAYLRESNNAAAIADFSRSIDLDPYAGDYVARGVAYDDSGNSAQALADFAEAIRLDPNSGDAYQKRGTLRFRHRQWREALADFNMSLDVDGTNSITMARMAKLLATAPEDSVRDGKRAVELATRACEATHWKDPEFIDVLAAALAETGDFDGAVQRAKQAIELETQPNRKAEYRSRLELYEAHKPCRA